MNPPALSIKDLHVTFRSRRGCERAVRGCSISIEQGEVLGLVGESGSGKSQLSLACLGLTAESGEICGQIQICGNKIIGEDKEVIRSMRGKQIAMIFQNPMTALNPFFNIGEQLTDMLCANQDFSREDAQKELVSAFSDVALPEPEKALIKYPHQFSGGQLQRIMIALALTCRTKVLIADEPTTALDVTTQSQIIKLLRRIVEEHSIALLFISHDMGVISELADRVAVMRQGEIVEKGDRRKILESPSHEYSRLLLESVPMLGDRKSAPPKNGTAPVSSKNALLHASKLSKQYRLQEGTLKVLKEVDVNLMRGECVALVGESGSGKSTLAMALIQLTRQSTGTIYFNGEEISQKERRTLRDARRSMSMVFQNPYSSLNPRMRIFDIVAEPLWELTDLSKEEIRQRVLNTIRAVGLEEAHLQRFPHAFSGGQRQRIALARAFVLEPELIILDEPTAALDVSVQAQVVELLNELRSRTNVTYLFITHNLALVERLANRVLVLYKGEILERGRVSEVFANPTHSYTRELLNSVPHFTVPNTNQHKL